MAIWHTCCIVLLFFYSSQLVLLVDLWLVRLLTAKTPSPNSVWQIMTLVSRVLCLWLGRLGLMFRESKGSVVRQTWHPSNSSFKVFTFASSNSQETNFLRRVWQGRTLMLFFFSIPIQVLDKNPPLSMLDLKKNSITEEGANMLAEARVTWMAKMQFEVIGPLVKDFGSQQQVDSDSFFGGRLRDPGVVAASRCSSEDWAGWQQLGRWSFDFSIGSEKLPGKWTNKNGLSVDCSTLQLRTLGVCSVYTKLIKIDLEYLYLIWCCFWWCVLHPMSGASHISAPFSGAAGEKHRGSTDFRLSKTFALKLRGWSFESLWPFNEWEWEKAKQKNDTNRYKFMEPSPLKRSSFD